MILGSAESEVHSNCDAGFNTCTTTLKAPTRRTQRDPTATDNQQLVFRSRHSGGQRDRRCGAPRVLQREQEPTCVEHGTQNFLG